MAAIAMTLPMLTAALSAASEAEVKAWMDVCKSLAEKFPELDAAAAAAKPKTKAKPKASKPKGEESHLKAWNQEVDEVHVALAEEVGVSYATFMEDVDESDEAAVKKAKAAFRKAAKDAGAPFSAARMQAGRLKAKREGKNMEEYEAKKAADNAAGAARRKGHSEAKKADSSASSVASGSSTEAKPKAKAAKPKTKAKELSAAEIAAAELDMLYIAADDAKYLIDKESFVAHLYDEETMIGDEVGVYDPATKLVTLK